ncbi:MAG: bifunctional (p)ppGpp synthetase/guanosine-3',5'-bis(diphosphate) 3'-pyrophosphohydrolase [Acidobacteriota bacterium]|nr:bifunctional (p)ppGpp synthetase/guanosine-3',5'-bis(diphosphate) 3'-pyrophosphohydrolase [Acidobacteriota bacterium]
MTHVIPMATIVGVPTIAFSRSKVEAPSLPRGPVRFEDVLATLGAGGREVDESWLRSIHEYAARMHDGQKRQSGEPYYNHPLQVAHLLAELKFDPSCVAVALLHDVLEDTGATKEDLSEAFGRELASLVDGVSKIGRHEYVRKDQAQAETFRKLILASARDIRVILVKIADRLHNMQTLEHLEPEKRSRIAQETLEIYAPLAHRLGMSRVKTELEDLSFFHLYPQQFADLQQQLRERVKSGRATTRRIQERLAKELEGADIEADISSRVKGYYSIYQKLGRLGIDLPQLYDHLAFRIVTPTVRDTYAALGIVHQTWRPIPGRFKDYIAVPKPNLYQSLHTTVVQSEGRPFEVQIRTDEMDTVAEEGIAAHWRYKEGRVSTEASDSNVRWLRQLLEWQRSEQEPRVFLENLKLDLYQEEVYVFSPKGDVYSFPRGATPLDFAYRVHTDLGHHCSGARINGKLVPLRTELRNGDVAEIQTRATRVPSRDWLKMVRTSRARSKIRQWLNTQQKKEAIDIGRKLFEQELRKLKLPSKPVLASVAFKELLQAEGLARVEGLYSRIGFGKTQVKHVLKRLVESESLPTEAEPGRIRRAVEKLFPAASAAVSVRGEGDLLAAIARCCNPVPGEPIVGYVTRGRGISVHSEDCTNVKNLLYHPEREIEVQWSIEGDTVYPVVLRVETLDQTGVLARLTEVIAKRDSNIRNIEAAGSGGERATIEIVVEVRDQKQLGKLREAILGLPQVLRVTRQRGSRKGFRSTPSAPHRVS